MQKLSIIVPCYNEEETVDIFYNETSAVLGGMSDLDWEFIFVDDGSKDATILALRRLAQADSHVRYLSFSRNFGKEAAMYAGLQAACGDFVSIMDVDLQDPPSMLPELLACVRTEGYDCAAVRRVTRRGEPRIRSFFARMFYKLVNRISRTEIVDGARDYRVMTRRMVDSILEITEVNRFSKGISPGWATIRSGSRRRMYSAPRARQSGRFSSCSCTRWTGSLPFPPSRLPSPPSSGCSSA